MSTKKKKNKSNQNWLHDHINDPYVKMAQREGYRARAAYKLKQIDEAEKLIKAGDILVDLGSSPGSWSQYARKKLHEPKTNTLNGAIIAIDILPMTEIADVHFVLGDFREESVFAEFQNLVHKLSGGKKVNGVMSDMAPNLSGIELSDAARMGHIAELVLEFAIEHLDPHGWVVLKCFHGSGYSQIVELYKKHFLKVVERKPAASRDKSSETFLLSRGLKKHG
jgi:23S rRNA (uridine2552-2'-O)-methyltransferase